MQNQATLAGKLALITGGAHRIGATIARTLHIAGMDVAIHYRTSALSAQALADELQAKRPASVLSVQADLHDPQAHADLIDRVKREHGRLDCLVNNASSFYPTPIDQANDDQWEDLIGTNLKAPFFLSKQAAPLLREAKGCIINLVDIHAERPLKEHPIYSIAKAGNAMMVKALARELGPEVRVNGVAPGAILWPEQGMTNETKQQILTRTALGRPGTPQDIAQAVLFLIRDAPYITGQILAVDGGRTLQQ